ncbi:hypothetical protein KBC04_04120 [Candidatus Babeliales bacterium]|nr:hypothetical protein [Candidatus Babeliales bacterium]MBP9843317.1 hypothetical protein [Candidatus Babeliales bacterium]
MIDRKKIVIFLFSLPVFIQAEFMLLDQGAVVVSGPVGNTIITHTDVFDKLNLDGTKIPLQHQIKLEVIRQQVAAEKMPIDETAADKYLANIQKVNNLTLDDLEALAGECFRTFAELKHLLGLQYTYDFFLYHKFRAHLVPSDQDVEDYCQEHPEVQPGHCVIQVAFVDFTSANKADVLEKLQAVVAGSIIDSSIQWSDPIKVNVVDIADDKQFIHDLGIGKIHLLEDTQSFELYKLVDKQDERLTPTAERKASVVEYLNRRMYEDLLAKYEEHMMDDVAIINLMD